MGYVLEEHHAYIVPGRWAEAERSRFWNAVTERVTIPALVLRRGNGTTATSTIGACLTVTLEDELIVNGIWQGSPNPYQLQVGDEIAGFNGVPWQEWVEKPVPEETRKLESLFDLPWRSSGGKEGTLSLAEDTGPWGGKYFNFHVKIDHFNEGQYPKGWPSFEIQPKPPLDFSGYDAIQYWIRCDTDLDRA